MIVSYVVLFVMAIGWIGIRVLRQREIEKLLNKSGKKYYCDICGPCNDSHFHV